MSSLLGTHLGMMVAWGFLAVIGGLGMMALVSPRYFTSLATRGGRWFDSSRVLSKLDTKIEVDRYVLPHSRVLGGLVIAAVALLAYFCWVVA